MTHHLLMMVALTLLTAILLSFSDETALLVADVAIDAVRRELLGDQRCCSHRVRGLIHELL